MRWALDDDFDVLGVASQSPPASEDDLWHCVRCSRDVWLGRMRRVRVRPAGSDRDEIEVVLLCEGCIAELVPAAVG